MRRMFSLEQLKGIADARVKALVEGGTLENAKPIYFHGINVYNSTNNAFEMHILNNSSEPINTIAKLKAWAESISGQVLIAGHGSIKIDSTYYSTIAIIKNANNVYSLFYLDSSTGSTELSNFVWTEHFTDVQDAVNKIN